MHPDWPWAPKNILLLHDPIELSLDFVDSCSAHLAHLSIIIHFEYNEGVFRSARQTPPIAIILWNEMEKT